MFGTPPSTTVDGPNNSVLLCTVSSTAIANVSEVPLICPLS